MLQMKYECSMNTGMSLSKSKIVCELFLFQFDPTSDQAPPITMQSHVYISLLNSIVSHQESQSYPEQSLIALTITPCICVCALTVAMRVL